MGYWGILFFCIALFALLFGLDSMTNSVQDVSYFFAGLFGVLSLGAFLYGGGAAE